MSLEQWEFFKHWLIVWKGSLQLYVLKKVQTEDRKIYFTSFMSLSSRAKQFVIKEHEKY